MVFYSGTAKTKTTLNRKEKIRWLKDLCYGRPGEKLKQFREQHKQERIEFAMREISDPLLELLFYALRTDNHRQETIDLINLFYDGVTKPLTKTKALQFIKDFEAVHHSHIAALMKELELQSE